MAKQRLEWIDRWSSRVETHWNLYTLFKGSSLVASFTLPAWAVQSGQLFAQYGSLSWVVAGFVGVFFWVLIGLLRAVAAHIKVRATYDERMLERGSNINPLDSIFERKRIFINDFALPSHPLISDKTFVDCDIIGPAIIYFNSNNSAQPIRPPRVDAVWLSPNANPINGFIFNNCVFRNCSFQRLTIFASIENYDLWKDNPNVNWISIPPTRADIEARVRLIGGTQSPPAPQAASATAPAETQQPAKSKWNILKLFSRDQH